MNLYSKKKKIARNAHKRVRMAINLNKETSSLNNRIILIENITFSNNWIEQAFEIKTENGIMINQMNSKNNKLLVKWWEN